MTIINGFGSMGAWPPNRGPLTEIQSFTYEDGFTHTDILGGLTHYIKFTLVPYLQSIVGELNESNQQLIADVTAKLAEQTAEVEAKLDAQDAENDAKIAALTQYVNEQVQLIIDDAIEVQDPVLAGILNDNDSQSRVVADSLFASKATQDTVETGRLSATAIDNRFSSEAIARNQAIANEKSERVAADALKRNIANAPLPADTDFDAVLNNGTYLFATPPTHTTAPAAIVGTLKVEGTSDGLITQTYHSSVDVYQRSGTGGSRLGLWRRLTATLGARPKNKVVFIGDSYMVGLGLTTPATQRWPYLFCQELGGTEVVLANSGSGYINAGSSGNFPTQSTSVPSDADTVIICGGINDAPLNPTQSAITTAIQTIANNIRSRAPKARIVYISPMWFNNNVTVQLMDVADKIRIGASSVSGVRYIEDAMWLRVDRDDLSQSDGHPNQEGCRVMSAWAIANIVDDNTRGATMGRFISPASADITITGPTLNVVADGTIKNARRGWWELNGHLTMYKSALGFLELKAGTYTQTLRDDVISGDTNPVQKMGALLYYHPGGDLYVGVGYRPNGSMVTTATGLKKNRVEARWISN